MKKLRFLSFVLVLIMLLSTANIFAAKPAKDKKPVIYTALGDSIAAGYGVFEETRYINLLEGAMESKYDNLQFNPMAMSGMSSIGLRGLLDSNGEAVKRSDIITVCIGANNLLPIIVQTMVQQAVKAFGSLTPEQLFTAFTPNQLMTLGITEAELYLLTTSQMPPDQIQSLVMRLKIKLASLTPEDIVGLGLSVEEMNAVGLTPSQLLLSLTPDQKASVTGLLNAGIAQFKIDWPEIMSKINKLAPSAKVYVMTVYNPLSSSDPTCDFIDGFISQINAEIIDKTGTYSYKVADVHTAFAELDVSELTGFYTIFDPHPTASGHEAIYQAHLEVIRPKLVK